MSSLGEIIIEFNANLKQTGLSLIDDSQLSLNLSPEDGRDAVEGFNRTSLAFVWSVKSIQENILTIQVDFENPDLISPSIYLQDKMMITFNQTNLLINPELPTYTDLETKEITLQVKKQLASNNTTKSFSKGTENANTALLWCLIASISLNFLFADGGTDYIT